MIFGKKEKTDQFGNFKTFLFRSKCRTYCDLLIYKTNVALTNLFFIYSLSFLSCYMSSYNFTKYLPFRNELSILHLTVGVFYTKVTKQ